MAIWSLALVRSLVQPVAVPEKLPILILIRIRLPTTITETVPDASLHIPAHVEIPTHPVPNTTLITTFLKARCTGTVLVPKQPTSVPVAETPIPPE